MLWAHTVISASAAQRFGTTDCQSSMTMYHVVQTDCVRCIDHWRLGVRLKKNFKCTIQAHCTCCVRSSFISNHSSTCCKALRRSDVLPVLMSKTLTGSGFDKQWRENAKTLWTVENAVEGLFSGTRRTFCDTENRRRSTRSGSYRNVPSTASFRHCDLFLYANVTPGWPVFTLNRIPCRLLTQMTHAGLAEKRGEKRPLTPTSGATWRLIHGSLRSIRTTCRTNARRMRCSDVTRPVDDRRRHRGHLMRSERNMMPQADETGDLTWCEVTKCSERCWCGDGTRVRDESRHSHRERGVERLECLSSCRCRCFCHIRCSPAAATVDVAAAVVAADIHINVVGVSAREPGAAVPAGCESDGRPEGLWQACAFCVYASAPMWPSVDDRCTLGIR